LRVDDEQNEIDLANSAECPPEQVEQESTRIIAFSTVGSI